MDYSASPSPTKRGKYGIPKSPTSTPLSSSTTSFPVLCNALILLIICYCYVVYYLCRFLLNRTLNFCPEFNFFFTNCFSSTDYTGYIQDIQEVQESKSSRNLYFDISLLTAKDKTQLVRVMVQRGESSKRQLFLQKMQAQQPVTLSNLQVASSNMVFLNRRTVIQDVPPHSIQFPLQPLAPVTSTPVDTILKNHNSGNFTVSGCIKWLGEPSKPEHATKMVREAEITDPTASINLSVWDSHIQQTDDNQF